MKFLHNLASIWGASCVSFKSEMGKDYYFYIMAFSFLEAALSYLFSDKIKNIHAEPHKTLAYYELDFYPKVLEQFVENK